MSEKLRLNLGYAAGVAAVALTAISFLVPWPLGEGDQIMARYLEFAAAVALAGVAVGMLNHSRSWSLAGLCLAVGGVAMLPAFALSLPCDHAVCEHSGAVAGPFAAVGFGLVLVGAALALVALGGKGRRRFLIAWAVAAVGFGIGGLVDSQWASGYDPVGRCFEHDPDPFGERLPNGPRAGPRGPPQGRYHQVQVWPPGIRCWSLSSDYYVPARTTDWLVLAGYSIGQGLFYALPLVGLFGLVQRVPRLQPRFP